MIPLPAFVQKNGAIFGAGVVLGALAAWGPASCSGKSQANALNDQKVIAAAERVKASAVKMEKAAALTEMALRTKTQGDVKELREIAREQATDGPASPGVDAVMQRLRQRAAAR